MFRFVPRRYLSSANSPTSCKIRQTFLDYFVRDHGHAFIKSSSVIPYGDPTVAFVNAGMNQFKSVLLGVKPPPSPKAANSQKCIRVGGKHNDLEAVGRDGSHHTFFEMLGNWSFGDYFKREACELAWRLLTGPYRMDPSRLVVTYFGGDKGEGLEPDLECLDIWRAIGVPSSRLRSCGMKDNFWEMGPVGPCGPCTEIHLDTGGGDLLEIWNLVFIEFERGGAGSLARLPLRCVDTGMGLERLTRVLQGAQCNYDTDLFTPLFQLIHKSSGAPRYGGRFGADAELDTAYRILADHARAVSVALADGMFPDHNHKLRRLVRRCLLLSERTFSTAPGSALVCDLTSLVADTLGDTYPELRTHLARSHHLLRAEERALEAARRAAGAEWRRVLRDRPELEGLLPGDVPGLAAAVGELKSASAITGELAFHLYDRHGLESALIEQLGQALGLAVDLVGLEERLQSQQQASRGVPDSTERLLLSLSIPPTDDRLKYAPRHPEGRPHLPPPTLECGVLALLRGGVPVPSRGVTQGESAQLVVDRTQFYSEAGGQVGDRGKITWQQGEATVNTAHKLGGYVLHEISVLSGTLHPSTPVTLHLDLASRLSCTQHHTATHLLNSALRTLLPATYQRSSKVSPEYLTLDCTVLDRERLTPQDITLLEDTVCGVIEQGLEVERSCVDINSLPPEAVLIPGEQYPDELNVLTIKDKNGVISMEPCCGTHCENTREVEDFCIVGEKSSGVGVRSIRAVAGGVAVRVRGQGERMRERVREVEGQCEVWLRQGEGEVVQSLGRLRGEMRETEMQYAVHLDLTKRIEDMDKKVSERLRQVAKAQVERAVGEELARHPQGPLVLALRGSGAEPLPLNRANSLCLPHRASLFIAMDGDGMVRARATLPKAELTDNFTAEKWMTCVLEVLEGQGSSPKGQDPKLVFLMKPKKISKEKLDLLIPKALEAAKLYGQKQ